MSTTPVVPQPAPVQPLGTYLRNGVVNFLERSLASWRSSLLGLLGGAVTVILAYQAGLKSGTGMLGTAVGVITAITGVLSKDN